MVNGAAGEDAVLSRDKRRAFTVFAIASCMAIEASVVIRPPQLVVGLVNAWMQNRHAGMGFA